MSGIRTGLQLYSVREDCAKNFAATLAAVAAMGYEGVELAGFYGTPPGEIKKMLDDNGLVAVGAHVGLAAFTDAEFEKTCDDYAVIGTGRLVVPSLPPEYRESVDGWKRAADEITRIAGKLKTRNMTTGFHNHWVEFEKVDGLVPWEIIFDRLPQDAIMQIDTGNALRGRCHAAHYIRKYAGRAITVHLKEWNDDRPDCVIGEGSVRWSEVFEACERVGGTEWYIVEQERWPVSALDSVRRCLENLRGMGVGVK